MHLAMTGTVAPLTLAVQILVSARIRRRLAVTRRSLAGICMGAGLAPGFSRPTRPSFTMSVVALIHRGLDGSREEIAPFGGSPTSPCATRTRLLHKRMTSALGRMPGSVLETKSLPIVLGDLVAGLMILMSGCRPKLMVGSVQQPLAQHQQPPPLILYGMASLLPKALLRLKPHFHMTISEPLDWMETWKLLIGSEYEHSLSREEGL